MNAQAMSQDNFIDTLAAMTPDQRRQAIEAAPLPANIGHLLDQAAADAGDTLAWNFFETGETITYAELVRAVNRTANALRAWGVTRGAHVAVMLPNCPQMPTIWLALARLGAVMVPVNVRYTRRELRYILDDSEANFLIVGRDFVTLLAATAEDATPLPVAADRTALVGGGADGFAGRIWEDAVRGHADTFAADAAIGHSDLMNIQYTSGTTGFPKGCMLTHRYWLSASKVNGLRDGKRYERVLASTPFFYLDPQWLLLLAFHHRGTLYVAQRQSASRFSGWLREHRINFCLFPEVVFKQPASPDDGISYLRRANIYGVRKEIHPELRQRFNVPAMEAFGMTETGPTLFVPLEATQMIGSGSCGVPTAFRECRVVDEDGHDVPRGEIGELVVRGPGMMLGYYKKPEANEASYFGDWFRTGDLFRQDGNGFFYIVGRLKDMVRRAGENIAAREVEAVLKNLPDVHDAAVIAVPDDLRGQEVKAYVVLQPHATAGAPPTQQIFDHCARNLAAFKVPRYLEFVDALPKTPSEKIAKSELIRAKSDLRVGAYDRVDGLWR